MSFDILSLYIFVTLQICGVEGVLVSERNVYCSEYRDVEISLAYVKRVRRTAVGCRINFNAYYSIPLQLYVVRSYRHLEQKSFIAKPFEFGSMFLVFFSLFLVYRKH